MGLLVCLFTVAASVWMVPIVRNGRVTAMVGIMLILGTVFGPFFFAINGPIQISLDRVVWGLILVYLAIQWRLGQLQLPTLHRLDWMFILLCIYLLISSQQGGDPPGEASPLARWLFYIAMPLGSYAMVRVTRLRGGDAGMLLNLWIGLGIYLAVTGLLEVKAMHGLVFPRYISDPKVWEFFGRGRGPLLNPIANGVLIGGALVAATLKGLSADRLGKFAYAAIALILLGGIYSTLTRSCWVGALGALGCIAMVYSPRWLRIWSLACVVLFAVAMSMGLKDKLMSLKRDKQLSAAEAAKSVELRPLLAIVAWEMFKDSPIRGHGFGHYFEHNDRYHNNRSYELPLEKVRVYVQHNTFLSIIVDGGLIGIGLFAGSLGLLFLTALSMTRTAPIGDEAVQVALLTIGMIVIYTANAMFHDLIVIPMVQMFLMTSAGLTVNAATRGILPAPTPTTNSQNPLQDPVSAAHPSMAADWTS